ncbi:MAG: YeiH family protein [Methylovirgula sp.]
MNKILRPHPVPPPVASKQTIGQTFKRVGAAVGTLLPGLSLTLAVTAAASALQIAEVRLFGRAWLEALVLAILIGAVIRTLWTPASRWFPGINFSAKTLLEVAVTLLGVSVSARTVMQIGPATIGGIVAVVAIALTASYGIGRVLGLPKRMAMLVACGNSICGNSAIAAVAPVIGADSADVASSIAFTAVLGVVVVLALPLLIPVLHMSAAQYGVLAGLTVYAVPQVLAATMPVGRVALQIGTLVKLVRVLMLGPVVLVLSLRTSQLREETDVALPDVTAGDRPAPGLPPLHRLVPWFIIGFLVLAVIRSFGLIPHPVLGPVAFASDWLTTISMAALGLGVDVGTVASAGARVTTAVVGSLLLIGVLGLLMIHLVGVV